LRTSTIDDVVAKGTDTSLVLGRVDFVVSTDDEDAATVYQTETWRASALVKLWEVGLVPGASLADVSDNSQARKTLAYSVDEMLVDATRVDGGALMHDWVVLVSFSAFATKSVNGHIALFAVTVEGIGVKDLITIASITVGFGAVLYFDSGSAARTVRAHDYCC